MRVNQIQQYNLNNVSFYGNKTGEFVDYNLEDYEDTFESESAVKNKKQRINYSAAVIGNTIKKNIWFSKGMFTKRHLKAFLSDPGAYLHEYSLHSMEMIDDRILGQVQIKNRKTKENENIDIECASFECGNDIYSLNKGKERLAFVDVEALEPDVLLVDYCSTIVGREEYRGLFLTMMQAVIENYIIDYGEIPEIQAIPARIGKKDFDRKTLYGLYGAEYKKIQDEFDSGPRSVISRDKVIQMLEGIQKSPKRNFLFPDTEHMFNTLKNSM